MKKPIIKVHSGSQPGREGKSRRNFLKTGGIALAGTSLLLFSCNVDDEELLTADLHSKNTDGRKVFNLGKGDFGILNYAYVLEQLEAAFYTRVVENGFFSGANAEERLILEDLYKHEVIHREFFKAVLTSLRPSTEVLPDLEFDFSSIDFDSRDSVLSTARLLEDTGVAAYNGAGALLQNPTYLLLAGKIVSVEARHASAIRSIYLNDDTAFAGDDVIDNNGLDLALDPQSILQAVEGTGFIQTKIISRNLPTG